MNIKNYKVKYDGVTSSVVAESIRGTTKEHIAGPDDLAKVMIDIAEINQSPCEQFWVIHLNSKNNIIAIEMVSQGGINASFSHPREVFRAAIVRNSYSIALCHNHPSGDTTPSREDITATKVLIDAGNIIGIKVVDHIIIGDGTYISLRQQNMLEF